MFLFVAIAIYSQWKIPVFHAGSTEHGGIAVSGTTLKMMTASACADSRLLLRS
jgi:hypothetical protein